MKCRIRLICIVFQVLEDVCKKHGLDPEEHGLKYVFLELLADVISQLICGINVRLPRIPVVNRGFIKYTSI